VPLGRNFKGAVSTQTDGIEPINQDFMHVNHILPLLRSLFNLMSDRFKHKQNIFCV